MADEDDTLNQAAQGQIRSIIERVERLEAEKAEIAEQIKEVFAEAKGNGFVPKILRKVVRHRKQNRAKRLEEEAIFDLYLAAMGELPLFEGKAPAPAVGGEITRISVTLGDGRTIGATPEVMKAALSSMATDDELYVEAVKVVRAEGKASVSYVQRRLQLGYNRAASLFERMEREGVVGPADAAGKREVLEPRVAVDA